MSDLADQVRLRSNERCEYCLLPQSAFTRPFHVEHIVAQQHGGGTELDNLALACWWCNLKKGPNVAGIDPETRQITPLFHPRTNQWNDHFEFRIDQTIEIRGKTPIGRATVQVLAMNEDMRKMLRYELWIEGRYGG